MNAKGMGSNMGSNGAETTGKGSCEGRATSFRAKGLDTQILKALPETVFTRFQTPCESSKIMPLAPLEETSAVSRTGLDTALAEE